MRQVSVSQKLNIRRSSRHSEVTDNEIRLLPLAAWLAHTATMLLEFNEWMQKKQVTIAVRRAIIVIHGAVLRKTESYLIRSGDFNELSNTLLVRTDKRWNAKSQHQGSSFAKPIRNLEAILALKALQAEKAEGQLLFPVYEAPMSEISKLIKEAAIALKWAPELQWCIHSLRHGGAQWAKEFFWEESVTFTCELCHMVESTVRHYTKSNEARCAAIRAKDIRFVKELADAQLLEREGED
jgi:hypothetical protein